MKAFVTFLLVLVLPLHAFQIRHGVGHKMQDAAVRVVPDSHGIPQQTYTPSASTNNPQLSINIALPESEIPCLICAVEKSYGSVYDYIHQKADYFRCESVQGPSVIGYAYFWLCLSSAII